MFADVTPAETTEIGWFTNPVLSSSVTLVIIAAIGVGTWWLTRGNRLPLIRDFVAGHVRRLLMKRATASPAPPTVEAPEAPAPQPAPKGADAPASPVEAPPPPKAEAPRLPDAPTEETPAWVTKTLIAIASVPTLLALPWAAYSVSQLLPVPEPVALPLGILFDVAMVGAVLVALLVPSVSRQASLLGWVAASAAAVAIAVHVGLSGALIFAATPLISKALWGLLIIIRRQQAAVRASRVEAERLAEEAEKEAQAARDAEEAKRAAELSTDLTFEQQEEIARLEREALYEEKLAAAKLKVKLAKSEAEHKEALAEIARIGEQKRAEDEESAKVWAQQIRLNQKLQAMRGDMPSFLAVESNVSEAELVGEVTASAGTAKAEFGVGFGFSRPLDVKALTPEGAKVSFAELPETHQALVKYVHGEKTATIRGASRKLDRDPRTIRRWKDRLSELGYELPIGE
ncbi:hypothetical protein ABZ799_01080 [Nocardiopsis dassonvillei]|uniref:hypothetical protein n=1 Tax=Nocardiopsis dassonvillei TaxID=2014 RepID=UPI0033FF541B